MQIIESHVPFSLLADIAEGVRDATPPTAAHLRGCQHCAATLAWLHHTIHVMWADTSEEPAELAVGTVKALYRTRGPRPAPRANLLLALLRFDSARATPAFGLRSAAATGRQLLFSADTFEIDLRVKPLRERWVVTGQLLSEEPLGSGHAELISTADAARADLSAESEFVFEPVRSGRYRLTISLADTAIVLSNVELGN